MISLDLLYRVFWRKIAVRDLRPGDEVLFGDGATQVVRAAKFGDGLVSYRKRLARVMMIELENGNTVPVHPGEPVRVRSRSW